MENNNRQGCRWTKASERLPDRFKDVVIKTKRGKLAVTCVDGKGKFDTYPLRDDDKIVYWLDLDESIEPCATSSKESVKRFDKVISCLAVELPMEVWTSVHYEWIKFRNETLAPSPTGDRYAELEKQVVELLGLTKCHNVKEVIELFKTTGDRDCEGLKNIDFIVWHSGMEEYKIRNAFERYKREIEQGQP